MQQNGDGREKIIDMADARKRQKALAKKPRAGSNRHGASGIGKEKPKFLVYLQLLVFLGLVAYMMQLCSH